MSQREFPILAADAALQNRAAVGKAADSCARLLLQEGQNYYTLGRDILSCRIQPLPDPCPPGVPELVYCMLQPDPADRPDIEQVGVGCCT